MGNITERPWGTYQVLYEDDKCKIKRIVVYPGKRLSLQSHKYRDELWKLIQGEGEVILEGYTFSVYSDKLPYSHCVILRGLKHRITNTGAENLVFIEIQTGESFDENDIVRYEDDYGRV